MGFWNYRVIKSERDGEIEFGIHECYYFNEQAPGDLPHSWTQEPVGLVADAIFVLTEELALAFKLPVLVLSELEAVRERRLEGLE